MRRSDPGAGARRARRAWRWGAFALALGGCLARGQEPPGLTPLPMPTLPRPEEAVLVSRTRRFTARGPNAAQAMQMLLFAEEVADRMARRMGHPIPAERAYPLRFDLLEAGDVPDALVLRLRVLDGAGVSQRIQIVNPGRADPEEVMEAIVSHLLDRWAMARQAPAERRERPAEAPFALAVGVAQDLYPATRARNHVLVRAAWTRGEGRPLPAWFALAPETARRPEERAFCGAAFGWLRSRPGHAAFLDAAFDRWAAGEPVPEEAWFQAFAPGGTPRDLDMEWNLWLAAQRGVLRRIGMADAAEIADLRERLRMPALVVPGAVGVGRAGEPGVLTPDVLLRARSMPWAREAARRMRHALWRRSGPARGAAFQETVAAFMGVLEEVAAPPASGLALLRRRPVSDAKLGERLAAAWRMLEALEAAAAEDVDGSDSDRPPPPPDLGASIRQRLDEWEAGGEGY